jgi:hypothetical protein
MGLEEAETRVEKKIVRKRVATVSCLIMFRTRAAVERERRRESG